jgi:hypothetical protein
VAQNLNRNNNEMKKLHFLKKIWQGAGGGIDLKLPRKTASCLKNLGIFPRQGKT